MWRKGNLCTLLVGLETGAATMENIMNIIQKVWKYNCHKIQQFYFWIFTQRKQKH